MAFYFPDFHFPLILPFWQDKIQLPSMIDFFSEGECNMAESTVLMFAISFAHFEFYCLLHVLAIFTFSSLVE